ncbi:uncharacterized protein LOC124541125 [Vanessa cardui]|uniref:uncharacterized protein LOC124541125 n=1 Tax=Vanessa cardui TaxID=171605 RepID=UPI001F12E84A|nr:uncharacterized protein LOC124541125 [Vanessa cardui]
MSVIILPFVFALFVAANGNLEGVDPNTLECDPRGQIFLLLPHFTDCSKFFMCAHGEEVEFTCSGGLIFDFVLQTCNWPRNTKCNLRTRPEEDDIEGSGEEEFDWLMDKSYEGSVNSLTAETVVNSVRPLSIETSEKMTNFNSILNCHRADSAARLVPYKGDCQRYWRCINGVPQSVYCSDGLYFNDLSQQCDFEANVKCKEEGEDELKSEFIVYK